jgi:hypothetical protein
MESPTLDTVLAAAAGAAAMLLLVTVVLVATRSRRSRRDLETMLDAAQREADDLRHRLEELTGRSGRPAGPSHGPAYLEELLADPAEEHPAAEPQLAEFVITHVGEPGAASDQSAGDLAVPDRLVLSATLGEPLVKVAAFSHGVRRALRAESRNRIWFEMRREVRAARKRRRRLVKDYLRETRAQERASEGVA